MWHRTKESADTRTGNAPPDPLRKMRRRLAWVLGTATVALIINAVTVVNMVHPVETDANVNGKPLNRSHSETVLITSLCHQYTRRK